MRCCFDKVRVELEPKEDHISQQISLAIGRCVCQFQNNKKDALTSRKASYSLQKASCECCHLPFRYRVIPVRVLVLFNMLSHIIPIRSDIVYRYDGKVDALTIYFAQATPGLISHSESDDDEICIYDFTQSDELVSIEILDASRVLLCHFYNESNKIDNLRYGSNCHLSC